MTGLPPGELNFIVPSVSSQVYGRSLERDRRTNEFIYLLVAVNHRGYSELKLQENLDVEIFDVLLQEARESYDEEIVVELTSENDEDIESNCARIEAWIDSWKKARVESSG